MLLDRRALRRLAVGRRRRICALRCIPEFPCLRLLQVCRWKLLVQFMGVLMKRIAVGVCLVMSLASVNTVQVAAQARHFVPILRNQVENSSLLLASDPGVNALSVLPGDVTYRLPSSSDYNWGAGWIGMGIGAAIGAGFGAIAPRGEGVDPGYVLGAALVCGIFGFVIGVAVGNS
jgi:hypothetical protein